MEAKISEIIRIGSNLSVIFPLIAYFVKIQHATKRIHIIGSLVIVSAACDLVGFLLYDREQSTVLLFNIYYLILFILLWWFYYEIVSIRSRRLIIFIGLAVYLQSFILVTLYVQDFFQYQSLMWVITGIIMIVFGIEYFLYLMSTGPGVNLLNYTIMWINTGVLVYFAFNLFLFLMSHYVLTQSDAQSGSMVWSFHNVNNIMKNLLFGIGLGLQKKKIAEF
jgi:hypothetical protein